MQDQYPPQSTDPTQQIAKEKYLDLKISAAQLIKELLKNQAFCLDMASMVNEMHSTYDPNHAVFREGQRSILSYLKTVANQIPVYQQELNKALNNPSVQ